MHPKVLFSKRNFSQYKLNTTDYKYISEFFTELPCTYYRFSATICHNLIVRLKKMKTMQRIYHNFNKTYEFEKDKNCNSKYS